MRDHERDSLSEQGYEQYSQSGQDYEQHSSTDRGSYRRDIMKVVGAGTALSVLGGTAVADEHQEEEEVDDEQNGEDDDEEGSETADDNSVHVVRTLISESTNPERPADFFYQPTGLHVEPGDVVKFVFETPDHTVTSYHPAFGMERRIPMGVQPISSPLLGWDPNSLPDDIVMPPAENGEGGGEESEYGDRESEDGPQPSTWLYSFDTPGVYDMECAPHEGFGMAMRVVVGEETETAFETTDTEQLPPPRAGPVGLARQVLTDPNLEPDAIVDEGRVEWMDLEANQMPADGGEGENGNRDGSENGDAESENGEMDENGDETEGENGA